MLAFRGWQWLLAGWAGLAVVVAIPLGKLLKYNRERYEAEEAFWKDQHLRSKSRWN